MNEMNVAQSVKRAFSYPKPSWLYNEIINENGEFMQLNNQQKVVDQKLLVIEPLVDTFKYNSIGIIQIKRADDRNFTHNCTSVKYLVKLKIFYLNLKKNGFQLVQLFKAVSRLTIVNTGSFNVCNTTNYDLKVNLTEIYAQTSTFIFYYMNDRLKRLNVQVVEVRIANPFRNRVKFFYFY
jgi:hypothetical protein